MLSRHEIADPKERLIFALDVEDIDVAERMVRMLAPHVGCFKIGPQLFTAAGPMVVDLIHGMGASVFLDLKFHDVPQTVAVAARSATRRRVKMFTVHALGGREMIRRASMELMKITIVPGQRLPVCLAIAVLTSLDANDVKAFGLEGTVAEASLRLARLAVDAGAGGIVTSAHELPLLKSELPEGTVFVVPGIRPKGADAFDQARVVTPAEAIRAGATYVVVGRPIRDAPDPVQAARSIVEEIGEAGA